MLNHRNLLLISILFSAALRCFLFFQIYPNTDIISAQDQKMYIKLSEYLLLNFDFTAGFGSERLPLYPLFVSLCRVLYDNLFFVLLVQNILGVISIIICYKIGLFFSKRIGGLCAFFAAVNVNFIIESNLILTESLFYPLFCFFVYYMIKYAEKAGQRDIIIAAVLLGICTLIRPVTIYLPIFILFFISVVSWGQIRKTLTHAGLFILLFILFISPWLYRNHHQYGHLGMNSQGGGHIIGFVLPYVMQYEDGISIVAAKKKTGLMWKKRLAQLDADALKNPFYMDIEKKKIGFAYLFDAPLPVVMKAWFWGAMKNVFSPATVELSFILDMDRTLFNQSPGETVPAQLFNFIAHNKNRAYSMMMVFGILGILVFRMIQFKGCWVVLKNNPRLLILLLLLTTYFLVVSGPVGYAKYRIPIEPVLILLTAFGLVGAGEAREVLQGRRLGGENQAEP